MKSWTKWKLYFILSHNSFRVRKRKQLQNSWTTNPMMKPTVKPKSTETNSSKWKKKANDKVCHLPVQHHPKCCWFRHKKTSSVSRKLSIENTVDIKIISLPRTHPPNPPKKNEKGREKKKKKRRSKHRKPKRTERSSKDERKHFLYAITKFARALQKLSQQPSGLGEDTSVRSATEENQGSPSARYLWSMKLLNIQSRPPNGQNLNMFLLDPVSERMACDCSCRDVYTACTHRNSS